MKIGELAKAAGVSKDAVRHYIDIGLLKPGRNPENGYQTFNEQSLNRLRFIKASRDLGLHLSDIQLIFTDAENARSPCPRVRDLLLERLAEARARIAELTQLCARMSHAVEQWEAMPNSAPDGRSVCRLIESHIGAETPTDTAAEVLL